MANTAKADASRESINALWLVVLVLTALSLVNVYLANGLYSTSEINKETAGRLPKTIRAAAPCTQCAAGGCKCCPCSK